MHQWEKDPQAVRRYTFDWADVTGVPVTDAVQSATITVTPSGSLTASAATVDASGRYVTTTLSGGVHGSRYAVLCHIVTVGGQQDDHTQNVLVVND